jgi:hypothetical protein
MRMVEQVETYRHVPAEDVEHLEARASVLQEISQQEEELGLL